MSPHAWTEDQLVEQPAIGLFVALGWQTVSALEESFGAGGSGACDLGRETKNWTFVVVTDRVELDEQIAKTFKTVGAVSEAEGEQCDAGGGAQLREHLRGNHRYPERNAGVYAGMA